MIKGKHLRHMEKNTSECLPSSEPCKALLCSKKSRIEMTQSIKASSKGKYEFHDSRTNVVKKNHNIFVLSSQGKPLSPTTSCRARKLINGGMAKKTWSKFNTFGIQMICPTREEIIASYLGIDHGTKFEGRSIVCGTENVLNIKLDLPSKPNIVKKIKERSHFRRHRRSRLRAREKRSNNRERCGFIAPSQNVIVESRLKIDREILRIFPVKNVAIEDVKGPSLPNFSTVVIGKNKIKRFFINQGIKIKMFRGWETKSAREKYGYKKSHNKSADIFESHCSDSLALAIEISDQKKLLPGKTIIVDDTYRSIKRKLFDSKPQKGKIFNSRNIGIIYGLKKGIIICGRTGNQGKLCGFSVSGFRFVDLYGKRQATKKIIWANNQFMTRPEKIEPRRKQA